MAVSKKKKKKTEKKVNVDDRFNLLVRTNALNTLAYILTVHQNKYSEEDTTIVINHIKEIYPKIKDTMFDYNIDDFYFIWTLESIRDILGVAYNNVNRAKSTYTSGVNAVVLTDSLNKVRSMMVDKLKADGIKHELLVSTSQLGGLIENMYRVKGLIEQIETLFLKPAKADDIVISVTNMQYTLVLYLMTYIDKYKNKEYDRYEFGEDGHTYLIYKNKPMLSLEDINHCLDKSSMFESNTEKSLKCIQKISKCQHEVYSRFVTKDMEAEYVETTSTTYYLDGRYVNFPLVQETEFAPIIPIEEAAKIPKERLYAAPKAGIRFEFVNKDKQIDYIDMKENKTHIFFNVYLISNGDVYSNPIPMRNSRDIPKEEILKGKDVKRIKEGERFKVSFLFEKSVLAEKEGYHDKIVAYGMYTMFMINKESELFIMRMYDVLMTCIYMAYYKPDLFRGEVRMYNRKLDKNKGYTREDYYRVAHLRKLPANATCSEEAKANARKEGFDYIPEGYTFVKSTNPFDSTDKKVIKIQE